MIAQAYENEQQRFQREVEEVTDSIKNLLVKKNVAYGNSALEPKRIFSKSSPKEQLLIRIDDKLSRIANQNFTESDGSDTIDDLIGYLVMYKIATKREKSKGMPVQTPHISPMQPGVVGIAYASSSPVTITSSNFEPNF